MTDKQTIFIDFTEGKKKFDTSKMDEWTQEEWKEWVGGPEDHVVQTILVNDSDLYLKMTSIYYDEVIKDMHVTFEAQNKCNRNDAIQFGKWKVDDQQFDLSTSTPVCLGEKSEVKCFEKSVNYMFMKSTLSMEATIMDVENKKRIREFKFILKIFHD